MTLKAMELYHHTAYTCSKAITQLYSTSFSLGIKTLDKDLQAPIYAIYGMVRIADEIVDTMHDYDKAALLNEFREHTFKAIHTGISTNPILHSFQQVVNVYAIDSELITAFFDSMEMDLHKSNYDTAEQYNNYIYGSAEVVGLMCLKVFCNGDKQQFDLLTPYAKSLGAAFQKVNFLRDMNSDAIDRGRVYFPNVDLSNFEEATRAAIARDIQLDFDKAYIGIKMLPTSSRKGVYLAYMYYLNLFEKIKKAPINVIMEERIRVSDKRKAYLLVKSLLSISFNLM